MQSVIRVGLVCALTACVFLAACQREPTPSSTSTTGVPRQAVDKTLANQLVAAPAWLHERLPDDTIAYVRIPSPWSLTAPDGRALDPLFANEAHVKMIDAIKQGLGSDPLIAKTGWQPVVKLLLSDLSSPLEVAVTGANRIASPASSLLISLRVRYTDVTGLNGTIEKLGSAQTVQLKTPFDAGSGDGELTVGGKSVFGHFDVATRRVTLLAGMTATAAALSSELKALAQPHAHPMQASEAKIDQSGQGLFVWLSVEAFRSAASMALNGPDKKFANDLVSQTRSASLGWGTVNGKGRFSFLLDAPGAKLLRYVPRSAKQTTLQTVGEPQWAVAMSLPTGAELTQFQAALGEDFGASATQQFTSALEKMKARIGFDLADLLGAFGPEVVGVSDASGRYTAVRLRDAAKFDALVKQLVDKFKLDHQTRNIGGATFHYLLLPSFAQMENAASAAAASPWLELYQRAGTHLYWIEQEGNLLFANIPQTLMDYRAATTHAPLAPWLTQQQGLDAAQALLAATVRTNGAQRSVYSAYLAGLQILADIAGARIDMFTLPSADALQLPRDGALGLQIHASSDDLGVDFIFEQTPLEALGNTGGGMTSVAVVAILAAIALPAYQDYTVRSHISEGLVLGDAVKTAIAEYYLRRHGLPHDLAAIGMSAPPEGHYVQSVRVEGGVIVITYNAAAGTGLDGHTLRIAPYANAQGELRWQCGSAPAPADTHALAAQHPDTGEPVPQKYLPANCRQ